METGQTEKCNCKIAARECRYTGSLLLKWLTLGHHILSSCYPESDTLAFPASQLFFHNVLWHTAMVVTVPCTGPVPGELHTFFMLVFVSLQTKPRCTSSNSSSCMLKSNRLLGGRLFSLPCECLEDLAILCQFTAAN